MAKNIVACCLLPTALVGLSNINNNGIQDFETTPQFLLESDDDNVNDDIDPTIVKIAAEERSTTNDGASSSAGGRSIRGCDDKRQQAATAPNEQEATERMDAAYIKLYDEMSADDRPMFVGLVDTALRTRDDDGSIGRAMEQIRRDIEEQEDANRQDIRGRCTKFRKMSN